MATQKKEASKSAKAKSSKTAKKPVKAAAPAKPVEKQAVAKPQSDSRRDFLALTAAGMGAVGACSLAWPFVNSMNPAKDTLALSTTEVDLTPIQKGQSVTVMWRGKPVFIRHRTEKEIAEAKDVEMSNLLDPQSDEERVKKPEWLVLVGVCTHLGCVPTGQKTGETRGEYDGWFCPCHGSHYDSSGRIRKGPAPKNLDVPPYEFVSDTLVKIG
jgi:ubiquinol-cytochrome c reductase iron-sulfur subunit